MSEDTTRDAPAKPRFLRPVSSFLKRRFALIVLAVFLFTGVWVLDDYGVALDTGAQRSITTRNLEYLLGRRDAAYPKYDLNRFYGVSFEMPLALLERALGLDDTRYIHLMRHLVTHLFFLTGGFFCYLLVHRLFENRLLAVFSMLLFLLHPRIYAHSFFNSKDIPFLSMFMICLYLMHRAFGNGNIWRFLILGIAVGVLINLRIMGVALFAMIVGMQILDAFGDRRHALGCMSVFVLSCAATLYAISPGLWGDPVGGIIESFVVFSQRTHISVLQMFRGDLILSSDVNPLEWFPMWISITTPPVVLVLGVAGMLIVFLRGLMSPRDVLANTRLRFCFMLVSCCILTVVAVTVVGSNFYDGWRYMYFLYAPFCVLVVFGLHLLTSGLRLSALSRVFQGKMLMYGAVATSIAAVVVAIVSLHSHQHLYFNFLVDRTTPEHLRSRYDMDYWHVSLREAYEHLLSRHPSASIRARTSLPVEDVLNWEILAETDRERLFLSNSAYDSAYDFYITSYKDWLRSESDRLDLKAPLVYSRVVYNSKVLEVAAVDLSLVDDAVAAPYRDVYNATISKQPDTRSNWDVYVDDATLIYIKEPCNADNHEHPPFFLHASMDDIDDLPQHRRRTGHVTRNFDFEFGRFGVRFDEICMAEVPLPEDGISSIRTGQFTSHGELWGVAVNMRPGGESAYRVEYETVVREDPVIISEFNVYLSDGRLIYVKESCATSNIEAEFFLDIVPSDADVLPLARVHSGSEVLRFIFETRGLMFDGMCVASIGLPDYDIKRVITGQYDGDEDAPVWIASYNAATATELPKTVEELRGRGVVPLISSHFDVYLDDGLLIYFRSPCVAEDVADPFFLHVHPADADDLPPPSRDAGFDSFSFGLLDQGVMVEGGCITSFDLPDYDVAGFSTGQFVHGDGNLWEDGHSFAAAELPRVLDRLRGRGVEPVVRSHFDVYMDDDRLIYVREPCDASDVEAEFFLHVVPSSVDDLPSSRVESGFDNLDFVFETHGLMFDGMCIASIGLPDYEIERIRTGQWDPEQQRDIWKEEFSLAGG